jgi:hypothetical protein
MKACLQLAGFSIMTDDSNTVHNLLKFVFMQLNSCDMASQAPDIAQEAVLVHSGALPVEPVEICGYDFNDGIHYSDLLKSFLTTGFQATNFAQAVLEINKMVCSEIVVSMCMKCALTAMHLSSCYQQTENAKLKFH